MEGKIMEQWKDIEGYEGIYQISSHGRVRSFKNGKIKIMKPRINDKGYNTACLRKDGKSKYKLVHRLVAEAFIPNNDGKPYVNHIDGNKLNNNINNLEWVTPSENTLHAISTGLLDITNFTQSMKGKKQSKEHIEKRKKFGINNPAYGKAYFKGRHHTDEAKKMMSEKRKGKHKLGDNSNAKKVIDKETGIVYGSVKEVAIKFGINYSTLKSWLKNNKRGNRFEYYKK